MEECERGVTCARVPETLHISGSGTHPHSLLQERCKVHVYQVPEHSDTQLLLADNVCQNVISKRDLSQRVPGETQVPLTVHVEVKPFRASSARNKAKLGGDRAEPTRCFSGEGGTKRSRDNLRITLQISSPHPLLKLPLPLYLFIPPPLPSSPTASHLIRLSAQHHYRPISPIQVPTSMAQQIPIPRVAPPTPDSHSRSNSFSAGLGIGGLPTPITSTFDPSTLSPPIDTFQANYPPSPERSTPPSSTLNNGAARRGGPFNFQPMIASKSPPIGKPVRLPF